MTRARHRGRGDEDAPFTLEDGGGGRAQRLQHLLFEEVDRLFRLEVNDSRLQEVSIVSLQLSPDLRNARVMFALKGRAVHREAQVLEALERVTPFLRARVADALSIKRTPDLHFHRDRIAEASLRAAAVLEAERKKAARKARAAGAPDEAEEDGPSVQEDVDGASVQLQSSDGASVQEGEDASSVQEEGVDASAPTGHAGGAHG